MKRFDLFFYWEEKSMSRRSKSRSSISIFTLIFWAIVAYNIFGGDDSDKKDQVEVREQQVVVEETTKKDTSVDVDALRKEASDLFNQAKKEFAKAKDGLIEELNSKKEEKVEQPDPPPKPQKREEVMIATPEKEKPKEEVKPTETKPTDMGMKQL